MTFLHSRQYFLESGELVVVSGTCKVANLVLDLSHLIIERT